MALTTRNSVIAAQLSAIPARLDAILAPLKDDIATIKTQMGGDGNFGEKADEDQKNRVVEGSLMAVKRDTKPLWRDDVAALKNIMFGKPTNNHAPPPDREKPPTQQKASLKTLIYGTSFQCNNQSDDYASYHHIDEQQAEENQGKKDEQEDLRKELEWTISNRVNDEEVGSETVLGANQFAKRPYSESKSQKVLGVQLVVHVFPMNKKIEDLDQILLFRGNCLRETIEVHNFSLLTERQIAFGQSHIKTNGQEQFGKQPRPPERVQRIEGALQGIQNPATFHHFTIEPSWKKTHGLASQFLPFRLEDKSFHRAGSIDKNPTGRVNPRGFRELIQWVIGPRWSYGAAPISGGSSAGQLGQMHMEK